MRKRRFDAVEVACVAVFVILVGKEWGIRKARQDLLQAPTLVEADLAETLAQRFGPKRHSQGLEEWIVRDFFNDQRNGVFVDVGAYHAVALSNTFALESTLGWSGVAVDAIQELAPEYQKERPKTRFLAAFVGDSNSDTSTIFVDPSEAAASSSDAAFTARFAGNAKPRHVANRTLDSLLEEASITRFDFLSMDIELGEPAALRGFTISRFRPRFVCIEAQGQTRQAILNYFTRNGYVVVGKYLRVDVANLYFMPLE